MAGNQDIYDFKQILNPFSFLKYSLTVKRTEKKRLETELREEEMALQRMESELRLAEQAFDQFLQENDRKAIAAMKRYSKMTIRIGTVNHSTL